MSRRVADGVSAAGVLILALALLAAVGCGSSVTEPSASTGPASGAWRIVAHVDGLRSFAFSDESHGWAVVDDAQNGLRLLASDDGGRSWSVCDGTIREGSGGDPPSSSVDRLLRPAHVLALSGHVYLTYHAPSGQGGSPAASGRSSGILASDDDGRSWRCILSLAPSDDSVLWLAAADADHFWAVCRSGPSESPGDESPEETYLLASEDAGRSWRRLPAGAYGIPAHYSSTLTSPPLTFVNASAGWSLYRPMAGDTEPIQSISTTTDGGRTWSQVQDPIREDELAFLMGFCALDERRAWAPLFRSEGSKQNVLASTADGGRTWRRSHVAGLRLTLLGVYFADTDHGWVAGCVGRRNRIVSTSDGGRHWTEEITLGAANSSLEDEWVFCAAGRSLFASNGLVLLSRELPTAHDAL